MSDKHHSRSWPPVPVCPPSFGALDPGQRGHAEEAWRAAHRLLAAFAPWTRWWHEFHASLGTDADPDPSLTIKYAEVASQAVEVLCNLRLNARPFSTTSARTIAQCFPPVTLGKTPTLDGEPSWQEMDLAGWRDWMIDQFRLWSRLEGATRGLIQNLEEYPRSVLPVDLSSNSVSQPVLWQHDERSYSLDGRTPVTVSAEMANALQKFAKADRALSTQDLEQCVANVTRVMRRIAERFPGTVRMPQAKGDGYYVRVRPAPAN